MFESKLRLKIVQRFPGPSQLMYRNRFWAPVEVVGGGWALPAGEGQLCGGYLGGLEKSKKKKLFLLT